MNTIQKLERIIENMKLVPDDHFDMSEWDCGTACCAFGASKNDKDFLDLGLYWEAGTGATKPVFFPVFEGEFTGYAAVAEFLGISSDDAYYLFDAHHYQKTCRSDELSKDIVIDRIQNYINTLKNEKASQN